MLTNELKANVERYDALRKASEGAPAFEAAIPISQLLKAETAERAVPNFRF